MLSVICAYLNNYFVPDNGTHYGTYAITNGALSLPFLLEGQYYHIQGSVFNDGIHKYPASRTSSLRDETFTGIISQMNVPPELLTIVTEIEAWQTKYDSPYQSESLNGYSYTKGQASTWQKAFEPRLRRWRKL